MPYRKDIDGLRAIAVLGVIFYHSEILIGNKFFLSGGFFESNFYDSEVAMVLFFIMALPFASSQNSRLRE